jgi:hypothetical protein
LEFSKGHALVIGVGTHKYSPENDVPITISDAESVAAILAHPGKCGYPARQVRFLHEHEATKAGILNALDQLAGKAAKDATVLMFFSGHGALGTDGQYYLVCHDAQFKESGGELSVEPGTGVSQAELPEKLRAIRAARTLLIFNACRSGSLHPRTLALRKPERPIAGLSLPEPTAAALLGTGEGRIIITACRSGQMSNFFYNSKLTFFTKALVDGLSGKAGSGHGFISAFSLYTYVYDAVAGIALKYDLTQEPMITVLQGVGPFAVALHAGRTSSLEPHPTDTLPEGSGTRVVTRRESQKWLEKIVNRTIVKGDYIRGDKVLGNKIGTQINTGGGAVIQGNVNISGGSFAGRDHTTTTYAGRATRPKKVKLSPAARRRS